ncbi:MAG: zinc ribbon domain-containing protein [Oscillospiraceae bacterium]|nr:zinc ribbon domain-containing protein [Oscillospiraceae bacterium]
MTTSTLFKKTMPFVWAKLILGAISVVASIIILALFLLIVSASGSEGLLWIFLVIWICATRAINFFLNQYVGYLVKAGHVAVIAEAVTTGQVPDNMVEYGKNKVKERFATSNVYFLVDKLVKGAVKQIQNGVGKIAGLLDFVPGMDIIKDLVNSFVSISLNYIDECCLGYTFYKKDESAFKGACDGVVIYAQNWKALLKNAGKTMAIVALITLALALVLFGITYAIFTLFDGNGLVAFLVALFIALAVKEAFIDSYIMCSMMNTYMEVAPSTQITFDVYGKLCNISGKFKELFEKGKQEQPAAFVTAPAAAGVAPAQYAQPQQQYAQPAAQAPVQPQANAFCTSCGSPLDANAAFCSSCGARRS